MPNQKRRSKPARSGAARKPGARRHRHVARAASNTGSFAKVALAVIIRWAKGDDGTAPAYAGLVRRHIVHLDPFWAAKTVEDFKAENHKIYIAERKATKFAKGRRRYRVATAESELVHFEAIVAAYAEKHGYSYTKTFKRTPLVSKCRRILTRLQVIRLLSACLGLVWCAKQRRMIRPESIRERRRVARESRMLRRMILLTLGTGMKEHCARRLRWTGSSDGSESFILVEAGALHRLGPDAPRYVKFQDLAVEIPSWLLTFLRTWRDRDMASGNERVLHGKDGKKLAVLSTALKRIGERAGLRNVTPGLLADTYAVWVLLQNGPLYGLAITMGLSPKTVLARFKHWRPDAHKRAIEALSRRPTRRRTSLPAKRKRSSPTRRTKR